MKKTVLSVQNVTFEYHQSIVLNDIHLKCQAGELIGVIGPNGAGKSTLLQLLMGLLKPNTGKVFLNDRNIEQLTRRDIAQQITLVPQDLQVNVGFLVKDIVAMGRHPWQHRFQPLNTDDLTIIHKAMQSTDIVHLADRSVAELSGGERQRVLIARAIAQQTPIILLDEASAHLDLCHQLELMALTTKLAEQGVLVLMAMHDLITAARYCHRLVLLANQGIQADGPVTEVITEDHLHRYFHLKASVNDVASGSLPEGAGLHVVPLASTRERAIERKRSGCKICVKDRIK